MNLWGFTHELLRHLEQGFINFLDNNPSIDDEYYLPKAVAYALRHHSGDYLREFQADYTARRDFLLEALTQAGFQVAVPKGTYFILAGFHGLFDGDDRDFAYWLTREHGVASLPPSSFYAADMDEGRRLTRFAFCKRMETLEAAAERLRRIG